MMSLADGIKKAGSADLDKLAAAFKGLHVETPFGPITTARRTISRPWARMSA